MKRNTTIVALAAVFLFLTPCLAEHIHVYVDNSPVAFPYAQPMTMQGRVLVPLRGVLEKLGAYVGWVPETRTVIAQRSGIDLQLGIGNRMATVNGRSVVLDVPAMEISGTTMVPLRFISEALGANVRWDGLAQAVLIDTASQFGQAGASQPSAGSSVAGSIYSPRETPLPIAPPPTQAAAQAPQISSFSHNATGWLRAGSRVEVVMEGTPGGAATFQIPGIARSIAMQETAPGHYVGLWTVPNTGITLSTANVLGRLHANGQDAVIQAGSTLAIDTTPPKITSLAPEPNGRLSVNQPSIYVVFDDGSGSGLDPNSVTLVVNGVDHTTEATITSQFLDYRPATPLPTGENTVTVMAADRAGNGITRSWTFHVVAASEVIKSFTHTATENMGPGDVFNVELVGAPGGHATFSIGDIQNQPMIERSAGRYVGEYTIRKGDDLSGKVMTGKLVTRDGQTFTMEAQSRLGVRTGPPEGPVLLSPVAGAAVTSPLVITGSAAPFTRVLLKVEYQSSFLGFIPVTGVLAEQEVQVDKDGRFKSKPIDLGTLFGGRGTQYTITATAVNASNQSSEPTVLRVSSG